MHQTISWKKKQNKIAHLEKGLWLGLSMIRPADHQYCPFNINIGDEHYSMWNNSSIFFDFVSCISLLQKTFLELA